MVNGQGGWIYRWVEIKMTHAANARIDLLPFPPDILDMSSAICR